MLNNLFFWEPKESNQRKRDRKAIAIRQVIPSNVLDRQESARFAA